MKPGKYARRKYAQWFGGNWPLWLLAAAAIVVTLAGGPSAPALRYERTAVFAGEWWRLLSGQLAHLGNAHLLLNLSGLALLGWTFGPGLRAGHWLLLLAGGWLAILAGFLLLEPQLVWYVGLSGLLHGLLLGALVLDAGFDWRLRLAAILLVIAKLGWEQWAGALPFTATAAGGPVVVDAHLYGGLGGLLIALPVALLRWRAPPV